MEFSSPHRQLGDPKDGIRYEGGADQQRVPHHHMGLRIDSDRSQFTQESCSAAENESSDAYSERLAMGGYFLSHGKRGDLQTH